ncbi:MAG: hypothetical protein Q8R89_08540 [Desulfomicrobium sp.]|nr:hypothetical protein [Desulfomicrobium sp.]
MKLFQIFLAISILLCINGCSAQHQQTNLRMKGVYAEIDTIKARETIRLLSDNNEKNVSNTILSIKENPENYAPPVLYELSRTLFSLDKKDEAAFWYYAGQLRARFDANRCSDISARQAVAVLNQEYGTPINQYTFQDLNKLESLIHRVVEWDRSTPHNYDHRWINLHGLEATLSAMGEESNNKPLSLPAEQWEAIAENTRKKHLENFEEVLIQAKSMQKEGKIP